MDGPPGSGSDPWLVGGSLTTITAPPRRPDAGGRPVTGQSDAGRWPRTGRWPTAGTAVSVPASFQGAFPAPPRPDRADALRDYVRGPYHRGALTLLGFMGVGLLLGYVTMAARGPWGFGTPPPSGTSFVSFTVAGIYLHNLLVVCVPILLFPLLFWAPGATAALTGYSIGRLSAVWLGLHLPGSLLVAALVPHGMVEIPATLLGGLMAWRLGMAFWNGNRFREPQQQRVAAAVRAAAPVVALVVIALGVAAFVEVKVTPDLVAHLAGL